MRCAPPARASRFCGRCLAPQMVAFAGVRLVVEAKPFFGWCVLASCAGEVAAAACSEDAPMTLCVLHGTERARQRTQTVNWLSSVVATNLFIGISFLSNSSPHTCSRTQSISKPLVCSVQLGW